MWTLLKPETRMDYENELLLSGKNILSKITTWIVWRIVKPGLDSSLWRCERFCQHLTAPEIKQFRRIHIMWGFYQWKPTRNAVN